MSPSWTSITCSVNVYLKEALTHGDATKIQKYNGEILKDSRSLFNKKLISSFPMPALYDDPLVSLDTINSNEYQSSRSNLRIRYCFRESPYGEYIVCWCSRGVVILMFTENKRELILAQAKDTLRDTIWISTKHCPVVDTPSLFEEKSCERKIKIFLIGTPFQIRVWTTLCSIPAGCVTTYAAIAKKIGSPKAVRAVGQAIGANRIAYLIPCHRVVRSSGYISGYRWGQERKTQLLIHEHVIYGEALQTGHQM